MDISQKNCNRGLNKISPSFSIRAIRLILFTFRSGKIRITISNVVYRYLMIYKEGIPSFANCKLCHPEIPSLESVFFNYILLLESVDLFLF